MKEKELEKIFKAFANKRRICIVMHLKRSGQSSVGDIAGKINLSLKATSKHLLILRGADIVEKEQVSLTALYRMSARPGDMASRIISYL